jgi:AcrR family transcriptional regulator
MGIQERKSREKSQRREAIIKAAKKIISKSGVENMSMNQLADTTELNKATLYLYFSNKDDLIDAIVYEGLILLEKIYKEANQQSIGGRDKVLNFINTMFDFYRKYPVYFYTMNHQERRKVNERLETPYSIKGNEKASRLFEQIAKFLKEGMEDGSIRKEIDVEPFLVLFFAHIYGVMHTIYSKEDVYKDIFGMDSEIIEKSALEMIAYYLKKEN